MRVFAEIDQEACLYSLTHGYDNYFGFLDEMDRGYVDESTLQLHCDWSPITFTESITHWDSEIWKPCHLEICGYISACNNSQEFSRNY